MTNFFMRMFKLLLAQANILKLLLQNRWVYFKIGVPSQKRRLIAAIEICKCTKGFYGSSRDPKGDHGIINAIGTCPSGNVYGIEFKRSLPTFPLLFNVDRDMKRIELQEWKAKVRIEELTMGYMDDDSVKRQKNPYAEIL